MSMRTLGWVLVVAAIFWTRPASACGCVDWPPERRIAEADRIFLGRTAKEVSEEGAGQWHFNVLAVFKGESAGKIAVERVTGDDCERSFNRGELAMVFVVKGHLPTCAGNVDLDQLMPSLGQYFGNEEQGPSLDAVKLALNGRVHGKKVSIYAPPLAGKHLTVGSTNVTFVNTKGDELVSVAGATRGAVSYVSMTTPERMATYFLVGRESGKLAVLTQLERNLKFK